MGWPNIHAVPPEFQTVTCSHGPHDGYLPPIAGPTWEDREFRVGWLLTNLSPGEKALLYQTLHDGENLRLDRCRDVIRRERAELEKAAKKDRWP
jgi:hypothetical protein